MEARFEVVAACTQEGYRVLNESVQKKQKSGRALLVFAEWRESITVEVAM